MSNYQDLLRKSKRLIIKIGSALVVDTENGQPRLTWLNSLADDIQTLRKQGTQITVVSSGAVALGRKGLGIPFDMPSREIDLKKKQAAASVGQIHLAQMYHEIFGARGMAVAQILLSPGDTENRKTHLNARATLTELLAHDIVPIINENDTTATEEIRFGDNDRLAARVAQMISADTLLILSTTDGLYTDDPRVNPAAKHIPVLDTLSAETMALAKDALAGVSTGGMKSKIESAKIAVTAGSNVIIASGKISNPIEGLLSGKEKCTLISANEKPGSARKRWILAHVKPHGSITIDEGAAKAVIDGKSLLPAGIRATEGHFDQGDAVLILGPNGQKLAIGLTKYSDAETKLIMGRKSHEIEPLLGYTGQESIHRDDLAFLE